MNKTEIVLFRLKNKIVYKNMNFCISGQKITSTTHARYLGILMDQHLSWGQHLKMLKQKLSRANGLPAKVCYYLSPKLLRTLYFSIFESHLRYGCQIWGQHSNHNLKDIAKLQQKAIQIINFKNKYTPAKPLFKRKLNNKIRKLSFGITSHKPMSAFKYKKFTDN